MARRIKISDLGPIACKYKVTQFKEDENLAEYKDSNFCSDRWLESKTIIKKYKKAGLIVSLVVFIVLLILIFFMCIIPVV